MRKLLAALMMLTLACSCSWADTLISADVFPDANFRQIAAAFDTNHDGTLQDSEIAAVTAIRAASSDIESLEGIRTFTSLVSLECANNRITSLDLRGLTRLAELVCSGSPITGNVNINTVAEYSEIVPNVREKNNATILTALDSEGNRVQYSGLDDTSVSPVLAKYSYNTGLDNVKLTVTALTTEAQGFASCTNGIFEGIIDGNIVTWKGIPYAKQPVGSLRWKVAEAPEASNERYDAFEFAPAPLQHESLHNPVQLMPRGEDCLALNVWNQSPDISSPKPVMVWVHGGSFNSGGTSNPDYNGENFIKAHDDVVLVSIGYRVGIMGFIDFANSGLPGGEDYPDSGNLSLLDIIEALRWIKNNIRAFGGDPENITVFGQSSGSASIALVMTMPQTAGLFRRAILQSGAVSMTQSIEDSAPLTQALVRLTGAQSMNDLLALSEQELLDLTEQLQGATNFPERDGVHIGDNPYEDFARNSANFEVLAGTMADEVDYWKLAAGPAFSQLLAGALQQMTQGIAQYSSDDARIPEQFIAMYLEQNDGADESEAITAFFNDLLFRVPTLAELENFAGRKYAYYWTKGSGLPGIGACHALDIPYVLNTPNVLLQFIVDDDLAGKVQDMWRGFAKSGVPSEAWTAYDTTTRATMIIDEEPSVSYGHLAERYALMTPLLKYGFSGRELIGAIAGLNSGDDEGDGDGDEPTSNEDTDGNGGGTPTGNDDTTGDDGDTPSNGDTGGETAPAPTNDPGSSGGGCSSGFGVSALCALGWLAFRKK